MASAAYALLITLCNVWSLIIGAAVAVPDVAVTCSEEALLPCKVLQDSSITYQAVSWSKPQASFKTLFPKIWDDIVAQVKKHICVFQMAGVGDRTAWKVLDVESRYPKGLGGSLELCNNTLQLRIRNATSQDSGTYKCTLGEQRGDRNLSGIVTLKVTGCPGIEDEKLKKYKTEISMLTCLGIFYLLLIFFTCVSNSLCHEEINQPKWPEIPYSFSLLPPPKQSYSEVGQYTYLGFISGLLLVALKNVERGGSQKQSSGLSVIAVNEAQNPGGSQFLT
ncbi:hypothetical protein ASZ78_016374 [Callipepla squamata]|uniref:Immunoglobulin domain-containing protein n=1 Tax=Callipepla squamata TaxID=9009 RepID=A0A226NK94_CALSU|nr:hypothetical protein ASZ78_016374 [Callipepla squamata]